MAATSTERLADVFVELADTLVDDYDLIEFLRLVAYRTAELVGASDVGLLLADELGRLRFVAASNEDVERLQFLQLLHHEGPCFDAFRHGEPVISADLRDAAGHWPLVAPQAMAAGFRSVHAIPLQLRQEVIGAMGVFGTEAGRLEESGVHLARALAHIATVGLLQDRAIRQGDHRSAHLQVALNSRIVVEQAKGAIALYRNISVDEAFLILRSHARRHGRLLRDVALEALGDPGTLSDTVSASMTQNRLPHQRT